MPGHVRQCPDDGIRAVFRNECSYDGETVLLYGKMAQTGPARAGGGEGLGHAGLDEVLHTGLMDDAQPRRPFA